jgi:ribosomal protein S18 acetylase RimI-like enzyme
MRPGANALTSIRPLRESDREPIGRLLVETAMFTDEEVTVALELIDCVLHVPDQHDYIISTAAGDGDRVLGYYCIGPKALTVGTFDLYWIAVSPDAQGSGVGTSLLNHAEAQIRDSGGRLIVVETSSQPKYEPTRKFYLRNSYSEVARIRDYYRTGDDLVVYGKYVSH